jgi:hypothetical protein
LYPVAIVPIIDQPLSEWLCWALFGFSSAAGLVFLTLIPAIRRGRDYVQDSGSPWRWAWYPWTLFGLLGFAVGARSALLAWSMHHIPSAETEPYIFGPYFLVPFGFAVSMLLLEIALVEGRRGALIVAMLLPALLLLLTVVGHRADPIYQWFLSRFIERLGGTPLYLTLLACGGLYTYAALRRVPAALDGLTVVLGALAFVSPHTLDLDSTVSPRAWPIMIVAVVQSAIGLRRRSAWRSLIGTACAAISVTISLRPIGAGGHQGPLLFHLALAAVLLIGAAFDDRLGRLLRTTGATMAVAGALVVMTGRLDHAGGAPKWLIEAYPLVVALAIAGYGLVLGHKYSMIASFLILSSWIAVIGCRGYVLLRRGISGLDYIAVGIALLGLAVLTSMAKGGVLQGRPRDRAKIRETSN